MASKEEQLAARKRRGYWIDRARRIHEPPINLDDIATAMGYSGNSASTVSKWIDAGRSKRSA